MEISCSRICTGFDNIAANLTFSVNTEKLQT
jgi:hypothetical protein